MEIFSKKKRAKGRSNRYDERQKRESSPDQKARQMEWRLKSLDERAGEGRLNDKNLKELEQIEAVTS